MVWNKNNKLIFILGIVFIPFFALLLIGLKIIVSLPVKTSSPALLIQNIKLAGREIKAEVVDTPAERYQGLSGRDHLCADCGMLFDFPDDIEKSFVMRNMKFPLDIIFISRGIIKNIAAGAPPEGAQPARTYNSDGSADQVLELNGGYCASHNIKPGDRLEISQ